MQRRALQVVLIILVLLLLTGCTSYLYHVTTGSHAPHIVDHTGVYVVWSKHLGVQNFIIKTMDELAAKMEAPTVKLLANEEEL